MTGTSLIEALRGQSGIYTHDADAVHKMIRDGDIHHIDGDLIRALADLLAGETATAFGCKISFDMVLGYVACREDGRYYQGPDALDVLVEAMTAQRQPWLVAQRWNGSAAA